ncbi:hypothetical protein SAMN05216330_104451 [Bradyrhizobium sp. Ghvi]|uniref:hypothetical protein n=1 Tax=Bradyrhizobium sp. Ghvi TaxID=1855319 RepID=UPI0008E6E3C9|nr:hypothetical protein [Bradyrhizobium sp. Ghvi]SFO74232.1 hypothetical protein SAMN05216330_104451 [Bradyrhizobium sp. Ghvi]
MADWESEFSFLKDRDLEPEIKKILLENLLKEKAQKPLLNEELAERRATLRLEKLKFWHNTPLVVALVGLVTIGANAVVGYFQTRQAAANSIAIKQLEATISEAQGASESERARQFEKLKTDLQESTARAEATRKASKEERDFAYKIIQDELAKSEDIKGRAAILLFLVRAGVLSSLNRSELEQMASADLKAPTSSDAQIPLTLGRPYFGPINICVGSGGGASCLGPGVVAYSCADYSSIGGGADSTYDAFNKRFCQGRGDPKVNVRHNFSIAGGQCGWTSFTVTCPS